MQYRLGIQRMDARSSPGDVRLLVQVKTFEEQQADATYSAQQTARLQQANSTHQAESADLMREFNLTVDQQRFLTQNYQVRTGAPPSVGSGLPPHPPSGSRGMLPPMQRTPVSGLACMCGMLKLHSVGVFHSQWLWAGDGMTHSLVT